MHQTSELIERLLKDDSFPSMAILDGAWGEGKTHFVKKTLLKDLEKGGYKIFYLSLTGISDVSEYRDRLLSVSFETIENTSRFLKKNSNTIGSFISAITGQGNSGLIGGILAGSAGIVREKLLHKLNNIRFVIDDLDRIENPKLSNLIIGESLQLSESNNIQFVFVVNESKSNLDAYLREKAFSGVAYLGMGIQDLIDIAFQEKDINNHFLSSITETVKEKKIKNLRVLKRIANKSIKINEIIVNDNDVDPELSFSSLGKNITLICHYLYEKGYDSEKVWKSINESSLLEYIKSKDSEEEKSPHRDLQEIDSGISEELVRYCAFEISDNLKLTDLGPLPIRTSKIDTLLSSPAGSFGKEEFEQLIIELKKFIFDDKNVPLRQWFRACDYYETKIRHDFIDGDADNFIENFEELCSKKEFSMSEHEIAWGEPNLKSESDVLRNNYNVFFDKKKVQEKESSNEIVIKKMTNSWKSVDMEIHRRHELKPFFNFITTEIWKQCLNNRTPLDLELFADFVNDRYKDPSVKHYLMEECNSLNTLKGLVVSKLQGKPKGQYKGSFTLVNLSLEKAVKVLKNHSLNS